MLRVTRTSPGPAMPAHSRLQVRCGSAAQGSSGQAPRGRATPRAGAGGKAAPGKRAGSRTRAGSKAAQTVELAAEVERLRAENESLREALARSQGCPPEEVAFGLAQQLPAEGPAAAAAAAAAPALGGAVRPTPAALEAGIRWPEAEEGAFWERPTRDTPLPVGPPAQLGGGERDGRQLYVAHVTAEMAPVAKVGGLGDVVTGLAKACLARGHKVEVFLPFYEFLTEEHVQELKHEWDFDCPKARVWDGRFEWGTLRTQAWTGKIDSCPVILLRPDWGDTGSNLFKGGRIYAGGYNEAEAYLYWSRAVLEYLKRSGRQPDVLHVHEWQASAIPMLFWEAFNGDFPRSRLMLTIHNMDSSGECRQDKFAATGVPGEAFSQVDKALDERTIGHNPERLCLLKGGIVYSNVVTTVSPNYATETLHGGAAGWLRSTLARPEVAAKYSGILNGIDTGSWDPATDPLLPACFSADMPQGKALCKRFLQRGLGMPEDPSRPLVAVISRLVPQKGIHLIEAAVHRTVEAGGQFVLLGTGHADGGLRNLAAHQYSDNPNVQLKFLYSEALSHLIYAAADIFLVPSMFEPCGLTQMIALRYGAIPVVHATGGLADTVKDVDQAQGNGDMAPNGFVFEGIDAGSLFSALDRAFDMYGQRPEAWQQLSTQVMRDSSRWSWDQAARSYVDLYQRIAA